MNAAVVNPAAGLIAALHSFTDTLLAAGPMVLTVGGIGLVGILGVYAVLKS